MVDDILAPYRDDSANYGTAEFLLSDHLPMAVAALAAMGATDERMRAWAGAYARVHELRPATETERARRTWWLERIRASSRRAVLADALTELAGGIGAAAFHPLIRAGYAIQRDDDVELAAALEAWEREYLDLQRPPHIEHVTPATALARLAICPLQILPKGLIATRMLAVSHDPLFAPVAASVPDRWDLDALTIAAGCAFAASRSFTALHIVTALYALRIIAQTGIRLEALAPSLWLAYAAAAIVSGAQSALVIDVSAAIDADAPSWEALLERAIAHDDEHVIKATYTCWRLADLTDMPLFRTAAWRYLESAL